MAKVNVDISRKNMAQIEITVSVAQVRIPWHVMLPFIFGAALIRLGAWIAGVSYSVDKIE